MASMICALMIQDPSAASSVVVYLAVRDSMHRVVPVIPVLKIRIHLLTVHLSLTANATRVRRDPMAGHAQCVRQAHTRARWEHRHAPSVTKELTRRTGVNGRLVLVSPVHSTPRLLRAAMQPVIASATRATPGPMESHVLCVPQALIRIRWDHHFAAPVHLAPARPRAAIVSTIAFATLASLDRMVGHAHSVKWARTLGLDYTSLLTYRRGWMPRARARTLA